MAKPSQPASIEREVARLLSLVSEALAAATDPLLAGDARQASRVVESDNAVDALTDEPDILSRRLTVEVSSSHLAPCVAVQVTLPGRFYQRLGDHAVNLAERAGGLRGGPPASGR